MPIFVFNLFRGFGLLLVNLLAFGVQLIPHSGDNFRNLPKSCIRILAFYVRLGVAKEQCIRGHGSEICRRRKKIYKYACFIYNIYTHSIY